GRLGSPCHPPPPRAPSPTRSRTKTLVAERGRRCAVRQARGCSGATEADAHQRGRGGHVLATVAAAVDRFEGSRPAQAVIERGADVGQRGASGPPALDAEPAIEPGRGPRHDPVVPLPAVAVVVLEDAETDRPRVVLLAQGVDEHEVAEALRHLLAV